MYVSQWLEILAAWPFISLSGAAEQKWTYPYSLFDRIQLQWAILPSVLGSPLAPCWYGCMWANEIASYLSKAVVHLSNFLRVKYVFLTQSSANYFLNPLNIFCASKESIADHFFVVKETFYILNFGMPNIVIMMNAIILLIFKPVSFSRCETIVWGLLVVWWISTKSNSCCSSEISYRLSNIESNAK
jgi:hypothetical protein